MRSVHEIEQEIATVEVENPNDPCLLALNKELVAAMREAARTTSPPSETSRAEVLLKKHCDEIGLTVGEVLEALSN